MLAEIVRIVRSSFTGRGNPSELYSHICHAAILNPFQELYLLGGANDLFQENQDESWCENYTESNNNASIYIPHNLQKLSSGDFWKKLPRIWESNAVCEEIVNLYIFSESRQENFKKGAHL